MLETQDRAECQKTLIVLRSLIDRIRSRRREKPRGKVKKDLDAMLFQCIRIEGKLIELLGRDAEQSEPGERTVAALEKELATKLGNDAIGRFIASGIRQWIGGGTQSR